MSRTILALAATALLMSAGAHADTRMSFSTGDSDLSRIAIKGDRVRMEGGDRETVTLFDATGRKMTVIEPAERRYYRMDAETVKRQGRQVSEQMRQAREQMEQQLQNVPEEQREMMREQMEQMLESQMPEAGAEPADIRIERGGGGRVAGVACERVTVHEGGSVAQRLCIAEASELGMSGSDMGTLRSLFSMLAEIAASFGAGGHSSAPAPARVLDEFGGIPIEATDAQGNVEWALQSVEDTDLDAETFRVPSGYREVEPFSTGSHQ